MKIKTKVLAGFLEKTKMSGKQVIEESALKFEKDGLKINANSPAKLSRVMAWLKTSAFKEYEELGNVCINDMSNVIKYGDGLMTADPLMTTFGKCDRYFQEEL